jgi:hypothetical protein
MLSTSLRIFQKVAQEVALEPIGFSVRTHRRPTAG